MTAMDVSSLPKVVLKNISDHLDDSDCNSFRQVNSVVRETLTEVRSLYQARRCLDTKFAQSSLCTRFGGKGWEAAAKELLHERRIGFLPEGDPFNRSGLFPSLASLRLRPPKIFSLSTSVQDMFLLSRKLADRAGFACIFIGRHAAKQCLEFVQATPWCHLFAERILEATAYPPVHDPAAGAGAALPRFNRDPVFLLSGLGAINDIEKHFSRLEIDSLKNVKTYEIDCFIEFASRTLSTWTPEDLSRYPFFCQTVRSVVSVSPQEIGSIIMENKDLVYTSLVESLARLGVVGAGTLDAICCPRPRVNHVQVPRGVGLKKGFLSKGF